MNKEILKNILLQYNDFRFDNLLNDTTFIDNYTEQDVNTFKEKSIDKFIEQLDIIDKDKIFKQIEQLAEKQIPLYLETKYDRLTNKKTFINGAKALYKLMNNEKTV
jgi:hypothetical protein